MSPRLLVLPDTFTSLGGNQFVDTPVLGNWSAWLSTDLKKSIIERYSCNGKFGLIGKSSGGYGAMYNSYQTGPVGCYCESFWVSGLILCLCLLCRNHYPYLTLRFAC